MLNQLLQQLGHQPTQVKPNRTQYRSPWNIEEKTPSCYVFKNNRWDGQDPLREFNYKDNSSGNGGNIYHFVMNYFNLHDFKSAKQKIKELLGADHQEQNHPTPKPINNFSSNQPKEESYKIIKTQTLQNKALIDYLSKDRGLTSVNLGRYLSEVYYEIDNKRYFAISFSNDSGGREVRNKYFKGSFGKKDITFISPMPLGTQVKIFEGFIDFLSYLHITKNSQISDYIILNSVSLIDRALKVIEGKYELIELYLDNDRAGNEATEKIINSVSGRVIDKRTHYKEFKDLNEKVLSEKL